VRSLTTGRLVPFDQPFWFAVAAFRPNVRIVGQSVAVKAAAAAPTGTRKASTTGRFSVQ
jgi:hypothetical protein